MAVNNTAVVLVGHQTWERSVRVVTSTPAGPFGRPVVN